jgi:anaerobic selenocysteine-containing dehydrogenase
MNPPPLHELGLRAGDTVRFRPGEGRRWLEAAVVGREKDGSVALRDARGRSRAIRPDRLEVRGAGPRGAALWEPVSVRAERAQQLRLM